MKIELLMKHIKGYFSKHPLYNSAMNVLSGMGVGILITTSFLGGHTLRWGVGLLALGVLGYLYAWYARK